MEQNRNWGTTLTQSASIFSNHLILSTILKFLSLPTLKTCREINSEWNLEATKIIKTHFLVEPITLRQEQLYGKPGYTVSLFKVQNIKKRNNNNTNNNISRILKTETLENFMTLISSSRSTTLFPFNNFSLADGQYLCSQELQDFLWVFGGSIEILEMEILYDPRSSQCNSNKCQVEEIFYPNRSLNSSPVETLLVHQLHNLKHLSLVKIPDAWKESNSGKQFKFSEGMKMRKLTILDLRLLGKLPEIFLHEFINAAPKLKELHLL